MRRSFVISRLNHHHQLPFWHDRRLIKAWPSTNSMAPHRPPVGRQGAPWRNDCLKLIDPIVMDEIDWSHCHGREAAHPRGREFSSHAPPPGPRVVLCCKESCVLSDGGGGDGGRSVPLLASSVNPSSPRYHSFARLFAGQPEYVH